MIGNPAIPGKARTDHRPSRRHSLDGAPPVAALVLALLLVSVVHGIALAAEPSAGAAVVVGGDPRSEGTGPGLVGSPVLVLIAVVGLGLATVLLTLLIALLARRR